MGFLIEIESSLVDHLRTLNLGAIASFGSNEFVSAIARTQGRSESSRVPSKTGFKLSFE